MALLDEVQTGDLRKALTAIRDRVAAALVEAEPRETASLAKELRAVVSQLDALPGVHEGSVADEVAAKRAKRRANARSPKAAGQ